MGHPNARKKLLNCINPKVAVSWNDGHMYVKNTVHAMIKSVDLVIFLCMHVSFEWYLRCKVGGTFEPPWDLRQGGGCTEKVA